MNFKTLTIGAICLTPLLSYGQLHFSFSNQKTFKQLGPQELEFEGGALDLQLSDGSYRLSPCFNFVDPDGRSSSLSPTFIPPLAQCPLGTNALFTFIDLDGDGVNDGPGYTSVAPIPISFERVAPFRKDEILLLDSPVSDLPASQQFGPNWSEASAALFYDAVNGPFNEFQFTKYRLRREYGAGSEELARMYREVTPGEYLYAFPRTVENLDDTPVSMAVTYPLMLENKPGFNPLIAENTFRLTNDSDWAEGELLIDPRVPFSFTWSELRTSNILIGAQLSFAIRDTNTDEILFPVYPPTTPANQKTPAFLNLPSSGFILGSGFFQIGDSRTAELTLRRNQPSTGVTTDQSQRTFRWDVRFVDTYEGFIASSDTASSLPEDQQNPDADADGDGVSNFTEYVLQTDPFDAGDRSSVRPQTDPTTGEISLRIPIRQNTAGELTYEIQFSKDLVQYTTITADTPGWSIVENSANALEVKSLPELDTEGCFLRVKVSTAP